MSTMESFNGKLEQFLIIRFEGFGYSKESKLCSMQMYGVLCWSECLSLPLKSKYVKG